MALALVSLRMQPFVEPTKAPSARNGSGVLELLVGSGDRIGLFTLPFFVIGVPLNVLYPNMFGVGGPPSAAEAVLSRRGAEACREVRP